MRSRLKSAIGTKQIKGEDRKMVKLGVVLGKIMDAWNGILNSSTKYLYAASIMHFRSVCQISRFPEIC